MGEVAERILHCSPPNRMGDPQRCRRVLLTLLTHDGLMEDWEVGFHLSYLDCWG